MREKIVFLEFIDEARAFLDYCKRQNIPLKRFLIAALQPEVQIFLKNLGIPYRNTLPYFSNEWHAKVTLKSEEWVRFLEERLNLEDGTEIKETYNNTFLFFIRFYMHHFLLYVEILSEACRKHEVESIHACVFRDLIYSGHPHIQDCERYVGVIAEAFSRSHDIMFYEIPYRFTLTFEGKGKFFSFRKSCERILAQACKPLLLQDLSNRKVILLASTGYNIGALARRLGEEFPDLRWVEISHHRPPRCMLEFLIQKFLRTLGIRASYLVDVRLPIEAFEGVSSEHSKGYRRLEKNIDRVIEKFEKDWRDFFIYKGVSFVEVMLKKIKRDLKNYLLQLQLESKAVRGILDRLNVRLLISPFARQFSLMVGELCKRHGIPALMVSHGTLVKPKNEVEKIEYHHMGKSLTLCEFYDYTAIQTPSEEKHFRYYKCRNKMIRTGPLIFSQVDPERKGKLKRKILKGLKTKKVLLYPENVRERNNLRFYVYETFDEFLSSSADLVNAVNEIEEACLIIRLHPGRKITPAELRVLLPESDKLIIDTPRTPFFEILTITDLLISFSSTAIEDALQNNIPVLLYDKRKRYTHLDSQELAPGSPPCVSAVYHLSDPSYLKDGLRWIIDNHLNKDVPRSIFDRYAFKGNYFRNLLEFILEKVG